MIENERYYMNAFYEAITHSPPIIECLVFWTENELTKRKKKKELKW